MTDLQAILNTYEGVQHIGQSTALATVVSTIGSTYRRPGVRMLVTSAGQTVGMVSGGCLESDVVEHAKQLRRKTSSRNR